ncbi:transcription factor e(y)2-domain-containing protein [Geranomyces variabilis]|nr:transcription factor e(y)2-domain-containing protein [Geranomyces variabilis]
MDPAYQAAQVLIDERLVKSGEKDRLKEYLRQRLIDCGWRDQMRAYAKEAVRLRASEALSVDEIVRDISPKGRAILPEVVKADLLLRVRKALAENDA